MKRFTVFVLASLFILALLASASFAAKVFGIGQIGNDQFFEILLDENFTPTKGTLMYADYSANKLIAGEITSVTINSNTKVSFSGAYKTADGISHTFSAVAEDLGTGENVDNFSITDSTGYSKAGTVIRGRIDIQ